GVSGRQPYVRLHPRGRSQSANGTHGMYHSGGKSAYKTKRISDRHCQFTCADPRGISDGNGRQTLRGDAQGGKVARVITFGDLRFEFAAIPELRAHMRTRNDMRVADDQAGVRPDHAGATPSSTSTQAAVNQNR